MTKLKALSVLQSQEYCLEKFGEAAVARVRDSLSDEVRVALFESALLPVDWVEVRYAVEHAVALDRLLGEGDGKLIATMVRDLAAKHMKGLYRMLFLLASPSAILEKSDRLWPRYYDRGASPTEVHKEGHATSRITGCPDLPQHHEWLVLPYLEEMLRQAGAKDIAVKHTHCVAHGAEQCTTDIRWR
jgi:hypothetical protein